MSVARRAAFAVLAVAAVAALLPAASASAATYSTKVVMSLKFPAFHGNLQSNRGSCLAHREVKLYRKANGPAKLLGTDTSGDNGKWSIPIGKKRRTAGLYFARVTARGNCGGDKSNALPIA